MLPLSDRARLLDTLPPVSRLALAYAPAAAGPVWLALLALDARLASVVLNAREPVLAQIKLAWWRERLSEPPERSPKGEPLLAALGAWEGQIGSLAQLVDGWEALLARHDEVGDGGVALSGFVAGRVAAVEALATVLGHHGLVAPLAEAAASWAQGDLANWFGENARKGVPANARLPRTLRPLVVLRGLSGRTGGFAGLLRGMRLGMLGF